MGSRLSDYKLVIVILTGIVMLLSAALLYRHYGHGYRDGFDKHQNQVASVLIDGIKQVHQLWLDGGQKDKFVMLDGKRVNIDPRFGYPSGLGHDLSKMNVLDCQYVLEQVLHRPPTMVFFFEDAREAQYTVRHVPRAGGRAIDKDGYEHRYSDLCWYHRSAVLPKDATTGIPDPVPHMLSQDAEGLYYRTGIGEVYAFNPFDVQDFKLVYQRPDPEFERVKAAYELRQRDQLKMQKLAQEKPKEE
ncbi:MAG: hypothetical protein ACPGUD_00515 [Parashewanella sp.]